MKTMLMKAKLNATLAALTVVSLSGPAWAVEPPKMKMTTDIPESITTPDSVETRLGTLEFFDGIPSKKTADLVYDYLDFSRAMETFLNGIPAASIEGLRLGTASLGAKNSNQVVFFDKLMDSKALFLTGNTSTVYCTPFLDLKKDGPTVVEIPEGAGPGTVNDAYFRFVIDMGAPGPDRGKGGKYLILPPDYEGDLEGPIGGKEQVINGETYFVAKSTSYVNWVALRGFLVDGKPDAATKMWEEGLKIYPLAKAANPPAMEFISATGKSFNTIHANNFEFYEELHNVIEREPVEMLDPELRGLFASIGIEKGKPFAPDARMKILTDAVAIANAASRSIVWYPRVDGTMKGIEVYPGENKAWVMAWVDKNVFFNGKDGKTMNSDARVMFHYPYTAVTPAMAVSRAGVGTDYGMAFVDSKKQPLDGSKTYKLRLPPNPPAKDFWALTMYDNQTRSQLQTNQQFPTVGSQTAGIRKNEDGSFDIYLGPKAPKGFENNWLETIPGKGWFVGLRIYGPLEPWIEKTLAAG